MKKRINLMAAWKEYNPNSRKSIKKDFCKEANLYKEAIIDYLNNGRVVVSAFGYAKDMVNNEMLPYTLCILTDGEYSWTNSLAYYVERYNLKLPKEFAEKVVRLSNK